LHLLHHPQPTLCQVVQSCRVWGGLFAGYLWAVCRSSPAGLRTASASTAGRPGPAPRRSGCRRHRSYCGQSCGRKTGGRKRRAVLRISTSAGFVPPHCTSNAESPGLTPSPSLHRQLLSPAGSRRFRPIQNQCCSWSSGSDSLRRARVRTQHPSKPQVFIFIYKYTFINWLSLVCFQSLLSPRHPKAGAPLTGVLPQG